MFFHVTQEALVNVWKRAQVPKTKVALQFGEAAVDLTVVDQRRGFVVPERLETKALFVETVWR